MELYNIMKDKEYLQILKQKIKQKCFWNVLGVPEVILNC